MRRYPWIIALAACCAGLGAQVKPGKPAATQKAVARSYAKIDTSLGVIVLELFDDEAPQTVANFLGLAEGAKAALDPRTNRMVKRPFYDGSSFHRVIDGFMGQAGCPIGTGRGGPGYQFGDEISAKALGLDKIMLSTDGMVSSDVYYLSKADWGKVMAPIYDELGISTQADWERSKKQIAKRLDETSVKDAYQRLGYQYDDSRGSHRMRRFTVAMANSGPGTNGSQFFINFKNNEYLNGRHTVFGRVIGGKDVVTKIQKVKVDKTNRPVEKVVIRSIRKVPAPKPAKDPKQPPKKSK